MLAAQTFLSRAKLTCVVAGCGGINGGNLVRRLLSSSTTEWHVIGIGRTAPKSWDFNNNIRFSFVSVDLCNKEDCDKHLADALFRDVTHMFFAAYLAHDDAHTEAKINGDMLRNCLLGLAHGAPTLTRIGLFTGTKYYGVHKGPYKTPAEEDDPRHSGPNFYFNQEDSLQELSHAHGWSWFVLRPNEVIGYSPGSAMNLAVSIAVYAVVCKKLNMPLRFPGTLQGWECAMDCASADLLAEMFEWLSTYDVSKTGAFNCSNGDIFRYKYLWPKIAAYFNMPWEGPSETGRPFLSADFMNDKDAIWLNLVQQYDLVNVPLDKLCSFWFLDFSCNKGFDSFVSMNKAKKAGFLGWRDTEECFWHTFDELQNRHVIPKNSEQRTA